MFDITMTSMFYSITAMEMIMTESRIFYHWRLAGRGGAFRSGQRFIKVGLGRVGHLGDRLRVHRVDDRMSVAAFARFPHAIDEELEVRFVSHVRPDKPALKR